MNIVAMVPIKLDNERLKNKNILPLGNRPLISYILETLSKVHEISKIYVYCSNEQICEYLPEYVEFKKRDAKLDLPTANFTDFFEAFSNEVDADIYVCTHATAPLISPKTISECIHAISKEGYDSAFSASKIQDFLWQNGKPLNFTPENIPRSQDLPVIYRETSGVYVFKKEVFKTTKRRIGNKPYIKEVSWIEAVDINTAEDFEMAKMIIDSTYQITQN